MAAEANNRFHFHANCCFDPQTNTIIDMDNGRITKYTPVSVTEGAVLQQMIRAYPGSVSKEELRRVIGAFCGEDEVRRVMSELKKRHPQLKLWIPRARDGEYRLLKPAAQDEPDRTSDPAPQRQSCTLKSTGICVRPNFVKEARADIFAQLDEAFQESHVVFLQGIGGIGKSEAAKHWALQKKKEGLFDTVVFAQLNSETSNSSIQSLVADDTIFVISGPFRSRDENESVEDYFHRKLAKIMQITDERTLIVVDNYDIDDPQLAALFAGSHRLLVTTRNRQSGYDFPLIPVTEIRETEHLKRIFFKNLAGERDDIEPEDPYIERLFTLVSNHTLTIEIIAKSLVNSADTPESLYRKIGDPEQHTLMRNVDGLVDRNFSEEPLTPFECIRVLFNLSRLEQDKDYEYKSQVLVFLAAMPTRGIELSLFKKWSDSRIIRAKNSLVRKSWLRQIVVEGVTFISMHPLVREVVWNDLKPTLKKCQMIIDGIMADNLLGPHLDGIYHKAKNVKNQYETIAVSIVTSFPIADLSCIDLYYTFQILFHHCARTDCASKIAYSIKDLLEKANETNTWRYGYILCRIGLIHETLLRDGESAIACLNAAITIMEHTATLNEEWFQLAMAYRSLAMTYCRKFETDSHHDLAQKIEHCLARSETIISALMGAASYRQRTAVFLGTVYIWRSKFNALCSNLDQADQWIQKAEEAFIGQGYPNKMDKSAILNVKALIYSARKEHAAEIDCLRHAIELDIDGFGAHRYYVAELVLRLAAAYRNNNQPEEAVRVLTHYQKIAEEMLGPDSELSVTIRNELRLLR